MRRGRFTVRFAMSLLLGTTALSPGMQSLVDKQHLAGVVDPTNDLVMVGIIQRQGGVPGAVNHEDVAREAVSAALPPPAR